MGKNTTAIVGRQYYGNEYYGNCVEQKKKVFAEEGREKLGKENFDCRRALKKETKHTRMGIWWHASK